MGPPCVEGCRDEGRASVQWRRRKSDTTASPVLEGFPVVEAGREVVLRCCGRQAGWSGQCAVAPCTSPEATASMSHVLVSRFPAGVPSDPAKETCPWECVSSALEKRAS